MAAGGGGGPMTAIVGCPAWPPRRYAGGVAGPAVAGSWRVRVVAAAGAPDDHTEAGLGTARCSGPNDRAKTVGGERLASAGAPGAATVYAGRKKGARPTPRMQVLAGPRLAAGAVTESAADGTLVL